MCIYSPLGEAIREVRQLVRDALRRANLREIELPIVKPRKEYGDISIATFVLAKEIGKSPVEIAKVIKEHINLKGAKFIVDVKAEKGFLNFFLNYDNYFKLILNVVKELRDKYGFNPVDKPLTIIVEHTSANPIKPLHLGHLRNALLGDSLARLLELRGHKVERHFYVDDVGLQVAYAAYGYQYVRDLKPNIKKDHWIGVIYTLVNLLTEVISLRDEYNKVKNIDTKKALELLSKIDSLMVKISKIKDNYPELFERIMSAIEKEKDPLEKISEINKLYEKGDLRIVKLIREMCNICIEGFKETLARLNISFDSWDWESDISLWSGLVDQILAKLVSLGYVRRKEGALVLETGRIVEEFELHEILGIPKNYEIPDLILVRSDGTTLYTTRDIAYTIWKFKRADKVINVIGAEQTLEQLQLKIVLWLLGYKDQVKNLIHYAYEMVTLGGRKFSGRRGEYITVDELLNEAVSRAYEIVKNRGDLTEHERKQIAEMVGIGAVKYAFLAISPSRHLSFTWNKVLDLTQNSGPFLQYACTRAKSILRKSEIKDPLSYEAKPNLLKGELEIKLMKMIGEFPEVVAQAADNLRVDIIASYANELAKVFNSFYDRHPVLMAENQDLKIARLALVQAFLITLQNALKILGIKVPEKM